MKIYSIPALVSAIFTFIPIYYTIKNYKRVQYIKLLIIFIFQIWLYSFGEFMLINSKHEVYALFWDKLIYFAVFLILPSYLHLLIICPGKSPASINNRYTKILIYLLPVLLIGILPTDYIIAGVKIEYWGYGKVEGPAYIFLRLYLGTYSACIIVFWFYKLFNTKDPRERNCLYFIGLASLFSILSGVIIPILLQPFGVKEFNIMFIPGAMFISSCIITYALVNNYLYDIAAAIIPRVRREKNTLYNRIGNFKKEVPLINSYDKLANFLYKIFECDVGITVHNKTVACITKNEKFYEFNPPDHELAKLRAKNKENRERRIFLLGEIEKRSRKLFQSFETHSVEAVIPIVRKQGKQIYATFIFGKGFRKKIYSKQDMQILNLLCEQIVILLETMVLMNQTILDQDTLIKALNKTMLQQDQESILKDEKLALKDKQLRLKDRELDLKKEELELKEEEIAQKDKKLNLKTKEIRELKKKIGRRDKRVTLLREDKKEIQEKLRAIITPSVPVLEFPVQRPPAPVKLLFIGGSQIKKMLPFKDIRLSITATNSISESIDMDAEAIAVQESIFNSDLLSSFTKRNIPVIFISDSPAPKYIVKKTEFLSDFMKVKNVKNQIVDRVLVLSAVHNAVLFQYNKNAMISASPQMIQIQKKLKKAARMDCHIIIYGDTGTGKELMAQYIHQESYNKGPFIITNCKYLNFDLFETKLFGAEKGAYTGAHTLKKGLLELADKGFLFFDELGLLPRQIQGKLLRVIEGSPYRRVGGKELLHPRVRFIAATNRNIKEMVKAGLFQPDLLYRLDHFNTYLPPLKERKEDIRLLAHYFLCKENLFNRIDCSMSEAFVNQLVKQRWPGNVRELKNKIKKAVIKNEDEDSYIVFGKNKIESVKPISLESEVEAYEKKIISNAFKIANGNRSVAAGLLKMGINPFRERLKKYNI